MGKIVRAIKANPGIRAAYRRKLESLVKEMHTAVFKEIVACYGRQGLVQDGPADALRKVLDNLSASWFGRWAARAHKIAEQLVNGTRRRTVKSLINAFKDAGFTIKQDPMKVANPVAFDLIEQNVKLITSIPLLYFEKVKTLVLDHAARGKDVASLETALLKNFYVTQRRAALIARDQSDKAHQAIKQAECKDLGVTEGIWVHLPGVKSARKTHMEFNGKRFDLNQGLFDSDENKYVLPGECICCRCTFRMVVPEFGD